MTRVRALREDGGTHVERGLALQKQGDVRERHHRIRGRGRRESRARIGARQSDCAVRPAEELGQRRGALSGSAPRREPRSQRRTYNFAVCLAAQGQYAGRRELLSQGARGESAVRNRVERLWHGWPRPSGRVDEAEADYRKAAERSPADPLIRFNIARMLIARTAVPGGHRTARAGRLGGSPRPRPRSLRPLDGARAGRRYRRRAAVRGRGARPGEKPRTDRPGGRHRSRSGEAAAVRQDDPTGLGL